MPCYYPRTQVPNLLFLYNTLFCILTYTLRRVITYFTPCVTSVGLMSKTRDPRAPVNLSAEELESHRDHPELAALLLQRSLLQTTLRTECGSAKVAKTLQLEQQMEYLKPNDRIGWVKRDLKCTALKDLRARWFDSMDHDEIKQQLKGEAASTFACQTRVWLSSEDPNLRRILFCGDDDGKDMVRYCACAVRPQFAKTQDPP